MPEKTIRSRLQEFADNTTCHGIGALSRSRAVHWRLLWTLALLSAFSVLGYQISTLWFKYRSYPISTKVQVKNDELSFPSVTICNSNPYRRSKVLSDDPDVAALKKALQELGDFEKQPDVRTERRPVLPRTDTEEYYMNPPLVESPDFIDAPSDPSPLPDKSDSRQKRSPEKIEKSDSKANRVEAGSTSRVIGVKNIGLALDGVVINSPTPPIDQTAKDAENVKFFLPEPTPIIQRSMIMSVDYELVEIVKNKSLERVLREAVQMESHRVPQAATEKYGHQAVDMIQWCRFLGEKCGYQNFTRYVSHKYGNCWTFNGGDLRKSKRIMMKRSGTAHGLKLVINAEAHDYMPVLSSASGVRVIIHPRGSFPFPSHRGYPIPVGYETDIGVTVRTLDRLGHPYGICRRGKLFFKETGRTFDSLACTMECVHRQIKKSCGCYIYYRYDDKKYLPDLGVRKCTEDEDVRCTIRLMLEYAKQSFDCPCPQPCQETEYLTTSALTQWPSQGFKDVLHDKICQRESELESNTTLANNFTRYCKKVRDSVRNNTDFIEKNFLALTIYFKHLNYESIIQEPAYPLTSFLSDMGGTMGLYAGISLLTGIEVVALVCGLIKHTVRTCGQRPKQPAKEKVHMMEV